METKPRGRMWSTAPHGISVQHRSSFPASVCRRQAHAGHELIAELGLVGTPSDEGPQLTVALGVAFSGIRGTRAGPTTPRNGPRRPVSLRPTVRAATHSRRPPAGQ